MVIPKCKGHLHYYSEDLNPLATKCEMEGRNVVTLMCTERNEGSPDLDLLKKDLSSFPLRL